MGFWDKALEVAKNTGTIAINAIEKSASEIRELKEEYNKLSDEELISAVHSSGFFGKSSKERAVAYSTLKRRGYSQEEIQAQKI